MLVLSSRDPEISPPDYVAAMPYGIFYDTMIHDFDMVRWLTGDEPVEIFARTACMLDTSENPHRDPDTAMVMLQDGERRARARQFELSRRVRLRPADRGIRCQRHADLAQPPADDARALRRGRHPRRIRCCYFFIERYAESYARELDDFVAALDERRAPSIGFDDGRRRLLIAEAAVASAKSGAPVAIPG